MEWPIFEAENLVDAILAAASGDRVAIAAKALRVAALRVGPRPRQQHKGADLAILGTVPDVEAAARLGVGYQTARTWRVKAGIPRFSRQDKGKTRDSADLAILGTVPDIEAAARLGVSYQAVRAWRVKAGIPRFSRQDASLLGTASDVDVARQLGVVPSTIRRWRAKAGIKPASSPRRARTMIIPDAARDILGTVSDADAAVALGISKSCARRWRLFLGKPGISAWHADVSGAAARPDEVAWYNRPEIVARLGIETDAKIAVEVGVTRQAVHNQRVRMGIDQGGLTPLQRKNQEDLAKIRDRLGVVSDLRLGAEIGRSAAWVAARRTALEIPGQRERAPVVREDLAKLAGTAPDREVAERVGVHSFTVLKYRHKHGIAAWRTTRASA